VGAARPAHQAVRPANVKGYFDHLLRFIDHAVQEQFVDAAHRALLLVDDSPEALLDRLVAWQPPAVDKVAWATRVIKGN